MNIYSRNNIISTGTWEQRYQYRVIGRVKCVLVINHSKYNNAYKQDELLINKIFFQFGGRAFQQMTGIQMDISCAPLLADLFLHAYEADLKQGRLENKDSRH
jgi:hypothetical protein